MFFFKYSHILWILIGACNPMSLCLINRFFSFFPFSFFFLSRFMKEKLKKRIVVVGTNQSEVGPRSALSACRPPHAPARLSPSHPVGPSGEGVYPAMVQIKSA